MADNLAGTMHIFDIDNTLVRSVTSVDFIREGMKRKIIPPGIVLYLPMVLLLLLTGKGRARLYGKYFSLLKGISKEELEKLSRELFEERFRPELDGGMANLISEIREKGGEVLIASASFRIILIPFQEALGARDIISTEIEFEGGLSTGRLREIPAYGRSKFERVVTYLKDARMEGESCSCYTDSHSDLPLLEFVGHPVAVNPGRKLTKIARRRNWPIRESHGKEE